MEAQFNIKYKLKKTGNFSYEIQGQNVLMANIRLFLRISSAILFLFVWGLMLYLSAFLPMKGWENTVLSSNLIYITGFFGIILLLLIVSLFFLGVQKAKAIFIDTQNYIIKLPVIALGNKYSEKKIPKQAIIAIDSYEYWHSNQAIDTEHHGSKTSKIYRLIAVPINGKSKNKRLTSINENTENLRKQIFTSKDEVPLPADDAVLLSESLDSNEIFSIAYNLSQLFNWNIVKDKEFLQAGIDQYFHIELQEEWKKQAKPKGVKIKYGNGKMQIKFPSLLFGKYGIIVVLGVGIMVIFFAFIIMLMGDVNFWSAFFPMLFVYLLPFTISGRIFFNREYIQESGFLLGFIPIFSKRKIEWNEIGKISIVTQNKKKKIIFESKQSFETLIETAKNEKILQYVISEIDSFIKKYFII